jgi:hypothetical protein
MPPKIDKFRESLGRLKGELERRVRETSIIVVLLGAGGKALDERRRIKEDLTRSAIIALIPEEDFPRHLSPSLIERAMLRGGDIELVFINLESWGSATEFGQFHESPNIAPKLRVLVDRAYHPLYGDSKSYLSDLYLTHEAVFGHVYATNSRGNGPFPNPRDVVVKLAERYRQWKALR